ncbi:probable serine/threonine-protein kinase tsuA [Schistocerca gregaria]|uniref:probable serine/threonine-protein kinase tsuA n=1 Tax=Schistocerca gregaria TaxID=7010 RepID=UPI00211DD89F|nr:probable serine/threonine-protein kinase tsuA [Schistocerca gregaria]
MTYHADMESLLLCVEISIDSYMSTDRTHCVDIRWPWFEYCNSGMFKAEGSDGDSEACLAMQQMGQAMRSYQASLLTPPRPPKSGHSPSREHSGCGPLEQQQQQREEVPADRMEGQEPPKLEQQQEELPQVGKEKQPEAAACPPLQLPPRPSPLSSPYVDLMDKLLSKII